ncbi:fibrinogen-like protein A [Apostichopus japonicus]|uniref:fibrinogen-like protein A n=1 Tax=Stichopus japonicus TaxID=307972 RepID=UPI003AB471DB
MCPYNMVYRNCSISCQRTCGAPEMCQAGVCNEAEACVCSDGYFMKESDCVPQEQCGCYASEGQTVIPESGSYVNLNCSRKGVCTDGQITWDEAYACSPNAVCDDRDNITQCYCTGGYRGDGENCTRPPKDCQEIYDDESRDNGIYKIKPTGWTGEAFEVYCNMTDGGGWTVFQRRLDGTVDFYLGWDSYKEGFGDLDHELWLGNDKLSTLTSQKRYEIRIDMVNRDGTPYYAKFDYFRINDESDKYRLSQLGTYSGTADSRSNPDGYALRYHLNYRFTTKDNDNDGYSSNCAVPYHGAWWYHSCTYSNLNGDYHASRGAESSPHWDYLPGNYFNIKYTEMKLRPF